MKISIYIPDDMYIQLMSTHKEARAPNLSKMFQDILRKHLRGQTLGGLYDDWASVS
jgi:hypothetical protein